VSEDGLGTLTAMKRKRWLVGAVALVTLGSGLVNLYSVMGPSLPERRHLLHEVFPLEFLQLSRFLTLVIGFALVISSINLFKRKKRAFQLVLLLAVLSAVFHLTKGLDYEEATFSWVLMGLLLWGRKEFTVKSSVPDLQEAFLRLGLAFVLAIGYGVVGFWILDPREFGIDFGWGDALGKTLLFLSLVGDPTLVPRTHYATWFLDSLSLMTATAVGYGFFALFRPVVYEFSTHPREHAQAQEIVQKYGRSSLDFFKAWPDKSFFFSSSGNCFLAYRVGGHFAVVLGDPVGPEEAIEPTLRAFTNFCGDNDWGLGLHQTLPDFLPIYTHMGFRKMKIGDDAIVDLSQFDLHGRDKKDLRNRVNRMEKDGVRVQYYEAPLADEVLVQVKEVSDEWLEIPGRRERGFTLGSFEEEYIRSCPVFAAVSAEGTMLAFANLIPSYCPGETTIDLMRRRQQAPNGVMDYLFVVLLQRMQEVGYQRFNLGMAPMAGFQKGEEPTPEERAIHYFFQQLNFLFSFRGLREYKAKFATSWEPRYVVYRSPLELPRLARALRKVSEIEE